MALTAVVVALGVMGVAIAYPSLVGGTASCPKCFLPLLGQISTRDVTCSLATGVCSLTIVNNSSTPLQLLDCETSVVVGTNVTGTYLTTSGSTTVTATQTITTEPNFNGTVGGPAAAGVPPNSQVAATCAFPTTELVHEVSGTGTAGGFQAKLLDSAGLYPAGAETAFGFEGIWS